MKKRLSAAIILVAVLSLFFFRHPKNPAPPAIVTPIQEPAAKPVDKISPATQPAGTPATISNPPPQISPSLQPENPSARAGMLVTETDLATNLPPDIMMQNVRRAIRLYGEMFGGNPVGTNPEITRALNRNNPKRINFINPQDGMSINANGEMVDAWGTPYFFHQLSGTDMEIHSAGPDKRMWTSDDLVAH